MDIELQDDPGAGRWEALVDGDVVGYAAYERGDGEVTLTHTVVEPAYEGQGVAGALVRAALGDARERGLAVLPLCPYVQAWLGRHPADLDLVPAERRSDFGL